MMYYGKSKDGSDIKQFEGVYINPLNPNEWSNKPYPTVTRRDRRKHKRNHHTK